VPAYRRGQRSVHEISADPPPDPALAHRGGAGRLGYDLRALRIASVGRAFPPNYYHQQELLEAFRRIWAGQLFNPERLDRLHRNVQVEGRHLALPIEEYEGLETWGQANDAWIRVAEQIGEKAVRDALHGAGIAAETLGAFISVSVTGIATPSLDARLMNRLRLPGHIKRMPIFGLGCVAGAAGIARAADYVRAFPDQAAVLLSVELCSLTVQTGDLSVANLISSGLFGDGAAAVVVVGEGVERTGATEAGPRIVDTQSIFYPDSERVMGWDISEKGFQVVLSSEVPDVVRKHLRGDVDGFLGRHGLERRDIRSWVAHPGGPKVLEAMEETLELGPDPVVDLRAPRAERNAGEPSATGWEPRPSSGTGSGLLLRTCAAGMVRLPGGGSSVTREEILTGVGVVARGKLGWKGSLRPGMRLVEDLGLDSLRLMTLAMEVENHFRICLDEEDEEGIETIGGLVVAIESKLMAEKGTPG